jgi:hypothetical protein
LLSLTVFAAVRIALLTFTSLGWRVPFRLHLLLQSINAGLLATFGLHPYCDSKVGNSVVAHGGERQQQATAAAAATVVRGGVLQAEL